MVIQQSMATFFYHAFVSIHPANHSDFFNTHACLQQQSPNDTTSGYNFRLSGNGVCPGDIKYPAC
jgi:hypothetical protein